MEVIGSSDQSASAVISRSPTLKITVVDAPLPARAMAAPHCTQKRLPSGFRGHMQGSA